MKARFYVDVWEFERGWGRRHDERKLFETVEEADTFVKEFNAENTDGKVPSWYMQADEPKIYRGK